MEEYKVNLNSTYWINDLKEIIEKFNYEENVKILIYDKEMQVGFTEIKLVDDRDDDIGERYFIDWIEIYKDHRRKGYLKKFINGLRETGNHISGGVADYYLYHVWQKLGGQFKDTWVFIIPYDDRKIEMVL